MDRRPLSEVSDYFGILRRRWPWLVWPVAIAVFLTLIISSQLQKAYRSETVVLVDPQQVPTDIVRMSASADVAERLQTISQQVLSRTQLQKLITQFGLYKSESNKSQEELTELMRSDITLEIVADQRVKNADVTAFKLSYTGGTPQIAQNVTRQLGSLFIAEYLKVKEVQAEGTNEFVATELQRAAESLREQEEKVKQFKSRYMGSLPEQQQANMAIIGQLQGMLQANNDALNRAQQNRAYLESIAESIKDPLAMSSASAQIEAKRTELLGAEQKYKPEHPDVMRLKRELAALEEQAKTSAATGSDGRQGQVKSRVAAIDEEIKERTRRGNEIEAKIRSMQGRIETLPIVEQQFAELSRDYEVQRANYQQLLQKRNSSSMAVQVERGAKGQQLRVLDPASLPEKPIRPNMAQINMIGLMLGAAIGGGIAFIKEAKDRSMHSDKDVEFYVPAPVLGCLPEIATEQSMRQLRNKKVKRWMLSGASASVMLLVIGFLMYRGTINFYNWF
jgi:polysaccharide chain length determinant protein (PEP-CTERM system associated)